MSTYIILLNWTEQGIKSVKESPGRYDAAKDVAKKLGATLEAVYMTFGRYDLVVILDAPNDEVAAQFNLKVTSQGNVSAETLKAFVESDYRKIVSAL